MSQAGSLRARKGNLPPSVPLQITTDDGIAVPAANNLNLYAQTGSADAGSTVKFTGSGDEIDLVVTNSTFNTIIGEGAGNATQSGVANTLLGYNVGSSLTTGPNNTVVGFNAFNAATIANANSIFGYASGHYITDGDANTAIGYSTLGHNTFTSGSYNTCLGHGAGSLITTNDSSNILIMNKGTPGDNNTLRIGIQGALDGSVNSAFIAGIVGVTVSNQNIVVIDSTSGELGVSDGTVVGETITGDSGGALSPTAGNWNILGGPGVTTSGSGSTLTINSVVFTDQPASTAILSDSGTFATNGAGIILDLPASPGQGELIEVACTTANVVTLDAPATHYIRIGSLITSVGGTAQSTAIGDALKLRWSNSDLTWYAISVIGTWQLA